MEIFTSRPWRNWGFGFLIWIYAYCFEPKTDPKPEMAFFLVVWSDQMRQVSDIFKEQLSSSNIVGLIFFYGMSYEASGWSHLNLLSRPRLWNTDSSLDHLDVSFNFLSQALHEVINAFKHNMVVGPNFACPHTGSPFQFYRLGLGSSLQQNLGLCVGWYVAEKLTNPGSQVSCICMLTHCILQRLKEWHVCE